MQLFVSIFKRNTHTDLNVTFTSLPPNLTSCNQSCSVRSHRRQQMQELGKTRRATNHWISFSFQNKPHVLEEEQHNSFQQWEHFSSPFLNNERKSLSHTDDHISLFTSAWHWACTTWASVNSVHKDDTMVACKSPSTGKHHVGNNISQRWHPASEEVIASSPADMNLSLLNNADPSPDARNPT